MDKNSGILIKEVLDEALNLLATQICVPDRDHASPNKDKPFVLYEEKVGELLNHEEKLYNLALREEQSGKEKEAYHLKIILLSLISLRFSGKGPHLWVNEEKEIMSGYQIL